MSLFGRKFDYRGESHVEPCSQYLSRDQKGGGQVDQTNRRYDEGGGEREGGNLICRAAAGRGGGLPLLLPALLLLHARVQTVVRMLVSRGGAERIHIIQHRSDIY